MGEDVKNKKNSWQSYQKSKTCRIYKKYSKETNYYLLRASILIPNISPEKVFDYIYDVR